MVIAGSLLAAELVSAWSSCGSGLRRLRRAWASTVLARSSRSAAEEDMMMVGGLLGFEYFDLLFGRTLNATSGFRTLASGEVFKDGLTKLTQVFTGFI